MANRRMISSSVWGDEKFITFNDVTRLVWFGLITNVDDQGRMQDNPLLIKAKLFPADRKSAGSISNAIDQLSDAGMITRYEKEGKSLVQIVNWWDHQSPSWAAASDFPAPDNWIDRVKIHAKGGGIQMQNWELSGGYIETELPDTQSLCSGYIATTLPATQPIEKVKSKVKSKLTTTTYEPDENFTQFVDAFQELTGIQPKLADYEIEAVLRIIQAGATVDDYRAAIEGLQAKDYAATNLASPEKWVIQELNNKRAKPAFSGKNNKPKRSELDDILDGAPIFAEDKR